MARSKGEERIESFSSSLEHILKVAVHAKGNHERFHQAGLIEQSGWDSSLKLSRDWRKAFQKLAPLSKAEVRKSPGLFLANANDIVYRGMTSGTSGQAFTYFASKEWDEARVASRRSHLLWWGICEQTPIINVASRLQPLRMNDLSIVGLPTTQFYEHLLNQLSVEPCVLRGYPSRLCEVATYLRKTKVPPVIAVICTGESLFEFQEALLKETFSTSVISEYGCQETGIFGMTCPESGRLHLDTDRCFYEMAEGQLITTDLKNITMPLVRYQCGDLLTLESESCPCGRPGLTAKILGRTEDRIRTIEGIQYPGEISLPSIPGILNYRVVYNLDNQLDIWIQTEKNEQKPGLSTLSNWATNTFGHVGAQIYWENLSEPIEEVTEENCGVSDWIDQITNQGIGSWLDSSIMPRGEALLVAKFLRALLSPSIIANTGLPKSTLDLLYSLLDSPTSEEAQTEQIKARILLFACCFFQNHQFSIDIYANARERLRTVREKTKKKTFPTSLDLLIPSLILPIEQVPLIWEQGIQEAQDKMDVLNVHHVLYALESAIQLRTSTGTMACIAENLKPILSVLIGDLSYFSPQDGVRLLAYWLEIIRGVSVHKHFMSVSASTPFMENWLALRHCLIRAEKTQEIWATLADLQKSICSPEQKTRFELERGYTLLMTQQALDPYEWLDIIKTNTELLSPKLLAARSDGVSWLPILRALIKPLYENGDCEFAYRCLVISSPPSSRISAFERLALQVNSKQAIIADLSFRE